MDFRYCKRFIKSIFLFGVLFNFRINYGIEICKISKLVMYLNSCSTDLGRDNPVKDPVRGYGYYSQGTKQGGDWQRNWDRCT